MHRSAKLSINGVCAAVLHTEASVFRGGDQPDYRWAGDGSRRFGASANGKVGAAAPSTAVGHGIGPWQCYLPPASVTPTAVSKNHHQLFAVIRCRSVRVAATPVQSWRLTSLWTVPTPVPHSGQIPSPDGHGRLLAAGWTWSAASASMASATVWWPSSSAWGWTDVRVSFL